MRTTLAVVSCAFVLSACATLQGGATGPSAVADLQPLKDSGVSGQVRFTQSGDKVRVVASVKGLKPGLHGFHIHEKGDCSAPDGMSAGGHFNPHGKKHGAPSATERHGGDLGNLGAGADGNAKLSLEVDGITIGAGAGNIVGRGVIVHADPDDFTTQPTGNAGGRVACAVIQAVTRSSGSSSGYRY